MMDNTTAENLPGATDSQRTVGGRIKLARTTRLKIDQTALGKLIGVSPMAVSRWERGDNALDENFVRAFAEALQVNYEWLLTGISSDAKMREATDLLNLVNIVAENERYIVDIVISNLELHLNKLRRG